MIETGKPQKIAQPAADQRCINAACAARFDLNARLYVCPNCDGLLDVAVSISPDPDSKELRAIWTSRLGSFDPRDRSGVWRYRELLPFPHSVQIVSLNEGNTPLYEAPKTASYCGLDRLRLKHQGANPTGSFKDTGMTTAVTQSVLLDA